MENADVWIKTFRGRRILDEARAVVEDFFLENPDSQIITLDRFLNRIMATADETVVVVNELVRLGELAELPVDGPHRTAQRMFRRSSGDRLLDFIIATGAGPSEAPRRRLRAQPTPDSTSGPSA